MNWKFDNNSPIHNQLVEKITLFIVMGYYEMGEKIPSVREFSSIAKVSPNTIQKALDELENNKLIYTKRTSGKYVTEDKKLINDRKRDIVDEKVDAFLEDMETLGFDFDETIKQIKERK